MDNNNHHLAETYAKRRKNILLIGVIVFFIFIITILIIFILDRQKSSSLDILVAPSFAKIEIDGKTYKTETTTKMEPGETKAIISADGFITQEIPLTLANNETSRLYIILTPTSSNANFYTNNTEEANLAQRISEILVGIDAELYTNEHPIITILPLIYVNYDQATNTWTEFRIDYGEFADCQTDFCLKITDTTGGNYDNALGLIREKSFNPDNYEIIYQYTPVKTMPTSTAEKIQNHYGV